MMGDPFDGFIQLAIVQHWDNVWHGLERWNETAYFHPWSDTLGYNDGYLIVGALYSVARAASLDPFLAQTAAFVAIRAVGFVFFLLFATEALALRFPAALLGAALVTISSSVYLQSSHGQLMTVSLAPLFAWLLWRTGVHLRERRGVPACAWGAAAALLFGAWLLTAFYTIWFTLFLLLLTGLAALALGWRVPLRWPLLVIAGLFIVAAIPFGVVYLPKSRETGMHGFEAVLFYSPSLLDIIHLGRGNLLFGPLDGWINDRLRPDFPDFSEHTIGFGPVLLALALLGAFHAWRERHRSPLLFALALATAAAMILALHIGRWTLWHVVYSVVPGAGAIRVTARIALLLTLPLVALAMLALQHMRRPLVIAALACLLVAEEYTAQSSAAIHRPTELSFLASIPAPPATCKLFFTEGRSPHLAGLRFDEIYPHNTDAMLISEMMAFPTINGLSTFNPPDWDLARPESSTYRQRIRAYLERHHIDATTVCGLDLETRIWDQSLNPK